MLDAHKHEGQVREAEGTTQEFKATMAGLLALLSLAIVVAWFDPLTFCLQLTVYAILPLAHHVHDVLDGFDRRITASTGLQCASNSSHGHLLRVVSPEEAAIHHDNHQTYVMARYVTRRLCVFYVGVGL